MASHPTSSDNGTPPPSDDGSSEIIFRGILTKQGRKHKTWRKRIMLLRKDHRIYYYKSIDKPPLGVIPLTDTVFSFRQGGQNDCNWPRNVDLARTITIATEDRTFYVYADTLAEVKKWLEQLAFVERIQKQKQKKATGGDASRALKSRMKKDKLNRQRTQRFQSSDGNGEGEGTADNEVSSDSSTSDLEDLDIQNVQAGTMVAVGMYATLDAEHYKSQQDDEALSEVSALNPSNDQEVYIVPDEEMPSVISTPRNSNVQEEKRLASNPLPPTPTAEAQADKGQDIYEFVADGIYESVHVEDVRIPDGSKSPTTELRGGDKPAPPPLPKERVSAHNLLQMAPSNFEPEDTYATVDENPGNEQKCSNSSRPLILRPPLPTAGSSGNSDAFEPAESADDFYTNVDLEHAQEVCYEEMTSPEPQDSTSIPLPVESGEDTGVDQQLEIYDLPSSPNALYLTQPCGPVKDTVVPTDTSGYIPMRSSSSSKPLPQDSEDVVGENAKEAEGAGFHQQGNKKITESVEGGYKTVIRDSTSSEGSDVDPAEVPLCDESSQEVKDSQDSNSITVEPSAKLNEGEPSSESSTCEPPSESNIHISSKEQDSRDQCIVVLHQPNEASTDANSTSNAQGSSPSASDQTVESSEQSQSTTSNLLGRNESLTRRSGSFMFKQRQSKAIREAAMEDSTSVSSPSALDAKIALDIITLEREKQQIHEERRRLEQEWCKLEQERQKFAQEKKEFQTKVSNVSSMD